MNDEWEDDIRFGSFINLLHSVLSDPSNSLRQRHHRIVGAGVLLPVLAFVVDVC